ncbi:MAG: prepilin-type N-terminal cleavage/methylation domain-containing protein, partial [bacterium]|nr:prepilin-type N-terminal cleavage/methylation domain-containing protein [bacterium]
MMGVLKNKKGFTLIELLAVIVIMAILLMIAIPSVNA